MSLELVTSTKTRILVVDDDPDICLALTDFLEHEGYHVDVKGTGAEAIEQLQSHRFGAAVLDLGLPDLDGLDVLKAFQEVDPKLPVIILTAYTTVEKTVGALSRGAFAFLTKPYNRDQLKATLKRAIGMQALAVKAETVESALMVSEDRFRSVVQAATDAIVLADGHGRIVLWNRAAERLFGYAEQEVMGRALTLLMPIRYRDKHQRALERFRSTVESRVIGKTLQVDGLRKDGGEFPIELSLGTWTTRNQVYYCGIIRDITERKQAEAALRASEERLELAVRGSSDGLWDGRPLPNEPWYSARTPVWYSPRFKAMLGFDEAEFLDVLESWSSRLHPDDKDRVFAALAAHIERKVPYDQEYRLLTKQGEYRWFRARGQAIWDQAGNVIRMAGSLQCITDRKRAEEELRHKLHVERTVAGILTRLVGTFDFDRAVTAALADIGRLSGASRAYLFLFCDQGTVVDNTHEWCAEGVFPEIGNLRNLAASAFPWSMAKLRAGELIHIHDVSKLPEEASSERESLERQGIKSLLGFPVHAGAELAGFSGFDNVMTTGPWREEDLFLLRAVNRDHRERVTTQAGGGGVGTARSSP